MSGADVGQPARQVFQRLGDRLDRLLVALDFDGVLAPIVEHPEDAVALPGTVEVLSALATGAARVAVVTGRPAAEAVRLGGLDQVSDVVVLGHYGLQRWEAGQLASPPRVGGVQVARRRVAELAAARPGVSIEDKDHSVALHTRRAPDPAGALAELAPLVEAVAADAGLQVTPGRFVLELRPVGVDKGVAIRSLVAELDASAVVYVGDDIGDLPAAVAVRELAALGVHGVVVCSDAPEASAQLRDAADLVVDGPVGVQATLWELVHLVSLRYHRRHGHDTETDR